MPDDLEIHCILDNYGTHKTLPVRRWLAAHPRFHLHFTPTSASWLNLVERWFAMLTEKQTKRGAHRSTRALENAIREYVNLTNESPRPFVWTKTADQILASVARCCQRSSDSGHWMNAGGGQILTAASCCSGRHLPPEACVRPALKARRSQGASDLSLQVPPSFRTGIPTWPRDVGILRPVGAAWGGAELMAAGQVSARLYHEALTRVSAVPRSGLPPASLVVGAAWPRCGGTRATRSFRARANLRA